MDLRHLRYFVGVAESQSFSRASVRLKVSQPALSRQVRALELDLGVQLFNRVGRRIALTAEGQQLLERGRTLLREAESLREEARAMAGGQRGVLRIGATANTLETFVPGLVSRFGRRHQGVDVQLIQVGGAALLSQVERGDLHLALTRYPAQGPLRGRPLFPTRVLAVMPPSHPRSRRVVLEAAELAEGPLLAPPRGSTTRELLEEACRRAQVRPAVVFESESPHTLMALARSGLGIAIASSMARLVHRGVKAVPVLQQGKPLGMWISIVWDSRRFLPAYVQAFIAHAATYASRTFPGKSLRLTPPPRPGEGRAAGR